MSGKDLDKEKQVGSERPVTIRVEIAILAIAVIASAVTAFWITFYYTHSNAAISPLALSQLHIILLVEIFIIGLAAIGLMYKSLWIHRAFTQNRRIVKEMEELSEVREMFIHMAQHRLRTPLAGVRWVIGMLKTSPRLSGQERVMVEKSEEKMKIAESLVEKMMKLHKADLSDFELSDKKDSIELSEFVREIIDDLDYLAREKKTEVVFHSSDQVVINGDSDLLKSALINVVDNAIRYSPYGRVTVSVTSSASDVTIVVEDNGVGMTEADCNQVFKKFYRGEAARGIDPNQSGIGMYLTKQIIGLHGGTIDVESEEDNGTTFTIVLPKL